VDSHVAEPWTAEIDVTAERAGALVAQQFPQLGAPSLTPLGKGWDNAAFLVNRTWVFRFPRRAVAAGLIEAEARILPLVKRALPLAVPVPAFVGRASAGYPWPFLGYRMLQGTPISKTRTTRADDIALASSLGAFLRALHSIDARPLVAAGLPQDTIGRLEHARMMPKVRERLRALQVAGLVREADTLAAFLERIAPAGPRRERLAVVHGDLYARHILVDEGARIAAIIDWGDVHLGDPALDLAIGFSTIASHARDAFFEAYGPIDAGTLELARYRAIYHSAMVAHYGLRIGDAELIAIGVRGLEFDSSG
jgi:aminoglycoside phosphotransferase (APT) family kinase protein